ncbi:MAG TPA: hypothetical protein VGM24_04720, partial [Puia sp.]
HEGKIKLLDYFKKEISSRSYADWVFDEKMKFLRSHMNGELNNLMRWLDPLIGKEGSRPATEIKEAMAVLMSAFPVYRIYPDRLPLSETDRSRLKEAFEKAFMKASGLKEVLEGLQRFFQKEPAGDEYLYFLRRWAQYTAPLAAKGTEDTVFYNYDPLISHNEVGDSPDHTPVTAGRFHELMARRLQDAGLSLNASSTHDSKRGEDNRLRINLISRYADEWIAWVEKWKRINGPFRRMHHEQPAPSAHDEYLIYQALVGAVPENGRISLAFRKRFEKYLIKALKEEKQETGWEYPDTDYEKYCLEFLNHILSPAHDFLSGFLPFASRIVEQADIFSLGQTLIKLTAPGIPDIYQGAECRDLSLVDPDNRLPVDYAGRISMMNAILSKEEEGDIPILDYVKQHAGSGAQKMFLIRKILHTRKKFPDLFNRGRYLPLVSTSNLIGYVRENEDRQLLVLVPLPSASEETVPLQDSHIHGRWTCLFSNQEREIDDLTGSGALLEKFPVAALIRQK